ncbi:hypothetical protein ACIBF5_12935 [Micromonospora sp. NPDC050417]|uniref:hypothetical protein n=1 Tax=Micromonospora sp. NPDC050417 TaxID=3364280 RepID=UPI0037AA9ECE
MLAKPPGNQSWVFDLTASDNVLRHRALTRHQALLAAASEALHWSNRVWEQAGTPAPTEPHLAAEMDQARAEFRWHRERTILGPISAFFESERSDSVARLLYAPYLVLYLRWEADYPQEWSAPGSWMWSPWGTKEVLLRELDRGGVPEQVRRQIGDLIVSALERPYRCKDWMYGRLVRHVLDVPFVSRVEALLDAEDPLVRLRAQFILHVARHPQRAVKRVSWQHWLSCDAGNGQASERPD